MTKAVLDSKLAVACDKEVPDLDEIKALIIAGADTNQLNEYNENIFDSVFLDALYDARYKARKLSETVAEIKEIISLMIENGWDVKKFGLSAMNQFVFSTYDTFTFELYRYMLQYDLADDPKEYEDVLREIGTEESYQRCCENNHDLENLFYVIYEMVAARMDGRDYLSIEPYCDAIGMVIDKVVYFSETDTTVEKNDYTEYNADIGFVCGNKLLILCDGVNILFMNDRIFEQPQIDISHLFGKNVIGRRIKSISFDHKDVIKETIYYGQPIIIMELANGKKLNFSHNFGELPDKESQSRFWME